MRFKFYRKNTIFSINFSSRNTYCSIVWQSFNTHIIMFVIIFFLFYALLYYAHSLHRKLSLTFFFPSKENFSETWYISLPFYLLLHLRGYPTEGTGLPYGQCYVARGVAQARHTKLLLCGLYPILRMNAPAHTRQRASVDPRERARPCSSCIQVPHRTTTLVVSW